MNEFYKILIANIFEKKFENSEDNFILELNINFICT